MHINCLVLDDEEFAIEHLLKYIAKIPFLTVVGRFTDPVQALTFLESNPVDLVFLDIEMPNFSIDGLDFVNIAGDRQGYIFTTAYPQYALKSYDYNAIDFLHKPISFERFSKAVQKAKLVLRNQQEETAAETSIYVRIDTKYHRINFSTICWIESDRNYITIYTEQGRIDSKLSISEVESQLPKKLFVRVHKSYIVAKEKMDVMDLTHVLIKRQNQLRSIPVGEAYRKSLLDAIHPSRKN